MIKFEHCLCHLATGDMLRAAVAAKTPLGVEVGWWARGWLIAKVMQGQGTSRAERPQLMHRSGCLACAQAKKAMDAGALVSGAPQMQ